MPGRNAATMGRFHVMSKSDAMTPLKDCEPNFSYPYLNCGVRRCNIHHENPAAEAQGLSGVTHGQDCLLDQMRLVPRDDRTTHQPLGYDKIRSASVVEQDASH